MSKEIFKVGDKVYHVLFGWGIISSNYTVYIVKCQGVKKEVAFDVTQSLISFTEYTLQGFTQERPIELPEVGELCLVRDDESIHWRVREFAFEHNGTFYVKEPCGSTDSYIYMKRIKILD
jgi:hypothetical protein